jgi:hypothetical protein
VAVPVQLRTAAPLSSVQPLVEGVLASGQNPPFLLTEAGVSLEKEREEEEKSLSGSD